MNLDKYFDSILNSDSMTINYTEITNHFELDSSKGEDENLLLWLCYQFNQRIESKKHIARARIFLQTLSLELLEANAYATDECEDEEKLTPLYDSYNEDLKDVEDALCAKELAIADFKGSVSICMTGD